MIDMTEMDNLIACFECGTVVHLDFAKTKSMVDVRGKAYECYICSVCKIPLNVKGKA